MKDLIMKFNEREISYIATFSSDREGRLNHKCGSHRDGVYRERWFKLKGNLLFYYRLNEYGAVSKNEPEGVYVLEQCVVKLEPFADMPFAFSVVFNGESDKKIYFSGPTQHHCEQWVRALSQASYEHLRSRLLHLQNELLLLTGYDPLQPYGDQVQLRVKSNSSNEDTHNSQSTTTWLTD